MQKIRTFFHTLFLSLHSSSYADVLNAPMRFSWKYFLALNAFLALLIITPVFVFLLRFDLRDILLPAVEFFPEELVITLDEDGVSVNQDLPYAIPIPPFLADVQPDVANIVVFDDVESASLERLREFSTLALVTRNTMYVRDERGMRVWPVPTPEEPVVFSRTQFSDGVQAFLSHGLVRTKSYAFLIALVGVIAVFLFLFIRHTVIVALFAVATWLAARFVMDRRDMSYARVFQIGLHSITLIILADMLFSILGVPFIRGWVYFFSFVAWTLYIISQLRPAPGMNTLPSPLASSSPPSGGKAKSGTKNRSAPKKKKASSSRAPAKKTSDAS